MRTDIAIVGGGASGLSAATAAIRSGAKTTILEKLPRVGKKILATGNGRCNLGNLSQLTAPYQGSVNTAPVFKHFPGETAFFRGLGLFLHPDEAGRLYPASDQAASVLDALRLACARLQVEVITDFAVQDIRPQPAGFSLTAENGGSVTARRVILATGGLAAPKFGCSGDGHALAKRLGHSVTACYPALAPIPVEPRLVRPLKGIRIRARVTARRNNTTVGQDAGQVQFTDRALSGICVFNLAHLRPDTLSLDLLPCQDDPRGLLTELMALRAAASLDDLLTGLLPKRIGQILVKACTDKPLSAPIAALSQSEGHRLSALIKDWQFPALPVKDWDTAQVTAGGVTGLGPGLASPTIPGLYFAGELLDVHGPCGGFNLRWAWASGMAAGAQAAKALT